jgi:hypothetical protein
VRRPRSKGPTREILLSLSHSQPARSSPVRMGEIGGSSFDCYSSPRHRFLQIHFVPSRMQCVDRDPEAADELFQTILREGELPAQSRDKTLVSRLTGSGRSVARIVLEMLTYADDLRAAVTKLINHGRAHPTCQGAHLMIHRLPALMANWHSSTGGNLFRIFSRSISG